MPKKVDHGERREAIARALRRVVEQHGLTNATMRVVAHEANIRPGGTARPRPSRARARRTSSRACHGRGPVFTVEPENQQRLVEVWQRGTDELMRHLPGFASANIHRSLDGTKVG